MVHNRVLGLKNDPCFKKGQKAMNKQYDTYTVVPFSKARQIITDVLALGERKHIIHGLYEVDVTKARQYIRDYEAATGKDISFTAFIVTCLGKAVDLNKHVQAYRRGGNHLVLFDDVDVNTTIEFEKDGEKFPLLHVIRAVNKKGYQDIDQDIQKAQAEGTRRQGDPTKAPKFLMILPSFIRRLMFRWASSNPHRAKAVGGTVLLTAVGMFGNGGGWGIPFIQHTLAVTLGGIAAKPVVVDGQIEIREMLSVTVSFDHDIVDGAPAARFASQFKSLIESGYGLVEQEVATEQVSWPA